MKLEDKKVLVNEGRFVSQNNYNPVLTDNINVAYTLSQEDAEKVMQDYEDELGVELTIEPLLKYYTPFI